MSACASCRGSIRRCASRTRRARSHTTACPVVSDSTSTGEAQMKRIAILLMIAGRIAAADDAPHAVVVHVAPMDVTPGAPIQIEAMLDAPYAEALSVRWRPFGEQAWHDAIFERSSTGGWYATVPPPAPPGIEYYIRGQDSAGVEVEHFASATAPHVVHVDPTIWDRLEVMDRARLGGTPEEGGIEVTAHNF